MKNKWDTSKIPDQTGQMVLVTGSNSGLGFETVKALSARGAQVVMAVRDLQKGEAARESVVHEHPQVKIDVMKLDLTDLDSVESFATSFLKKYSRLDLLINNAGVMVPPFTKTKSGFELQMGVNHLGHFALTGRLISLIVSSAPSRIVNVASMAHLWGKIDFNDLHWEKRKYKASQAYADSKIANLYFTYDLGKQLAEKEIPVLVTAAHPGYTASGLTRHSSFLGLAEKVFAQKTLMGALPSLRAAVDPEVKNGDYFGPGGFLGMRGYPVKVKSSKSSHNQQTAIELREVSEELTGVKFKL
ncbi:MAG: oxidoreductase [Leptospirales bacterium]